MHKINMNVHIMCREIILTILKNEGKVTVSRHQYINTIQFTTLQRINKNSGKVNKVILIKLYPVYYNLHRYIVFKVCHHSGLTFSGSL